MSALIINIYQLIITKPHTSRRKPCQAGASQITVPRDVKIWGDSIKSRFSPAMNRSVSSIIREEKEEFESNLLQLYWKKRNHNQGSIIDWYFGTVYLILSIQRMLCKTHLWRKKKTDFHNSTKMEPSWTIMWSLRTLGAVSSSAPKMENNQDKMLKNIDRNFQGIKALEM